MNKTSFIKFSYQHILKPVLFLFDPELIHDSFLNIGNAISKIKPLTFLYHNLFYFRSSILEQEVDGIKYENPVGLSAGFDKE
ncbi:MAG TPA: hypothetical protein VHA74_04060, partial [Candidatus Dojkabacteria bacterium]|nr:hypothetical protein [Candidatus Dojkabacteria bacterium]